MESDRAEFGNESEGKVTMGQSNSTGAITRTTHSSLSWNGAGDNADTPKPDWLLRHQATKLHKKKKAKMLQSQGISGGEPVKKKKQLKESKSASVLLDNVDDKFKVDHTNVPVRWKDHTTLETEFVYRERIRINRLTEPVRHFPGDLRKNAMLAPKTSGTLQLDDRLPDKEVIPDHLGNNEYLKLDQSRLPIDIFDNSEMETKTPQEWLDTCTTALSPFFWKGRWEWSKCEVLSYDYLTQKYDVRFTGTKSIKKVKRINLLFTDEDRALFDRRVAAAKAAREVAKSILRFDHYVSQRPAKDVRPMTQLTLDGIKEKVVSGLPQRFKHVTEAGSSQARLLRSLTSDAIHDYTRSMKKAVMFHAMAQPTKEGGKERDHYSSLRLPPVPSPPPQKWYGKVAVPEHAFSANRTKVASTHYTCMRQVLGPLVWMYNMWEDSFSELTFVDTKLEELPLPCQISHFNRLQSQHCLALQEHLLLDWRRALAEHVVDSVQDVFDFFLTDPAQFYGTPLARLLKSIELRMSSQLRHCVHKSVDDWIALVERFTDPATLNPDDAPLLSSIPVANNGSGAGSSLPSSSRASLPGKALTPLFDVCLKPGASSGTVVVSPCESEIEASILSALDRMVEATQSFHTVDHELMSLLHLEPRRVFNIENDDPLCADTDAKLADTEEAIKRYVANFSHGPRLLALRYQEHVGVLDVDIPSFLDELRSRSPPCSPEELCAIIRQYHTAAGDVSTLSYDQELFSAMRVECSELKQRLISKAQAICAAIQQLIVDDARRVNLDITERYKVILARIGEKPRNETELASLKAFTEQSKETVAGIKEEVSECMRRLNMLDEFGFCLGPEDVQLSWSTMEWPERVEFAAANCESALEEDKIRMMDKLALEKELFDADVERFEEEVKLIKAFSDISQTDKNVEEANTLQDSLLEAKAKGQDFNQREKVFGFPPTEYSILGQVEKELAPYYRLWNMVSDFEHCKGVWLTGPFLELDSATIEQQVTDWWKTSYKLSKQLEEESPGAAEVAATLRERTTQFREYLPVIQSLASRALRERHWEVLGEKMDTALEPDEELTLQALLDMNVGDHLEAIQEVCVVAEKEYSLERSLQSMMAEWEPIEFEVAEYKETGTHLIRGTDDIVTLLDDHLVKAQTMRGSPYIKPIEKECRKWEKKLLYAQHLVDEWLKCQRTWLYLEPIFSSEDIMRQMPTEARRFASVDALWRKTMQEVVLEPNFMEATTRDKLGEKFIKANEKLDEIQKGLNDYLELKRLCFPRFFFLSNDELLEILSQTKEPRAVQPHLGKCFEGVTKVRFESDLKITQMISAEGEVVDFMDFVDPESGANKGNVELWLLEVEARQWDSIKDHTRRGLEEYPTLPREEWSLRWPAQVVLGVSQVYWTREVVDAVNQGGAKALSVFVGTLNESLSKIVLMVRGKLTKLERSTLGALVVVDVHARDVVQNMVEKEVESVKDFEWISQFRYYWEEDRKLGGHLVARIVNAQVKYGYEYLGNSSRLVITPLTDRCYRTMMGAVDLLYGGAPEGPAGTGKTETVKDLSKAVAIQCVVFNCSDGLDYLAMAKFFKGLAGCGSWCCFDEFNRINIEVLSVIAQQILTINKAKRGKQEKFHFEGTYMKLNPSANVFITMNPGYAGRAELPDNLKALFRPCAMMVPDYALIAEIRLYSFGFQNARTNAQKLVRVLGLSSEQLSSQKHYDYGMRAVNSILVAAGNLRQQLAADPEWSEEKIVLRSVNDVNLPKFTTDDLPLFTGITSDLFPGVALPSPDHGPLIPTLSEVCVNGVEIFPGRVTKLQPKDSFISKVVQLYETVAVRHGLMVVGTTHCGKTCITHVLGKALTLCAEREQPGFVKVQIHTMNPKSITSGQLYGNFDENTHEWSDGVLARIYREVSKDQSPDLKWVMFDGPVDAVWIENMNTVLDDNKKLCLMSGEIVKMSSTMTMMFEAEDLEEASPATVSRVGMVYMEPKQLGWEVLLQSWLETRMPESLATEANHEYFRELMKWMLPPALFFVQKHCFVPTPVTPLELVASLLNLLSCTLVDTDQMSNPSEVNKTLECITLQAVIWSVGGCVDRAGRTSLDAYLRAFLMNKPSEAHDEFLAKNRDYEVMDRTALFLPPDKDIIYDYKYDVKGGRWLHWLDLAPRAVIPRDATFHSILVPTIDTTRYSFLLEALLTSGGHVLITGDTGTGKTVSINQKLLSGQLGMGSGSVNPPPGQQGQGPGQGQGGGGGGAAAAAAGGGEKDSLGEVSGSRYTSIFVNFSARTSANQTQDIIDNKLDKRRKGVLGPPPGKTCIIFVDDLNMPAKETYGAQPPIELLRQWMDHGGWYERKENTFRQLVDVQFVAAMGPPGGGRTQITQRYVRHFNLINFCAFDAASLNRVFTAIMDWYLGGFPSGMRSIGSLMVAATIDLYHTIAATMLPTPAKSHYTFNLRDLSKVFQGISQGSETRIKEKEQLVRLWSHECLRVFHDRLVDADDRVWFKETLGSKVRQHFSMDYEKRVRAGRGGTPLIFGNFMENKGPYDEVEDMAKLYKVMSGYLEDFNSVSSAPMSLVLFENAMEHVARCSRVINQPFGNALLVGVGGSGRKSLTSLAVSIADYELFQIEITKGYGTFEFHEDLKKVLTKAGQEDKSTVFLFSDTQIIQESFLEDINGILNTGEVANLFNSEEHAALLEAMAPKAAEAGLNSGNPSEVYNFFVTRCRTNLHVVLCLSPIGDAFRTRLRMFPSLVNCCTIDWFTEWPEQALRSVAEYFLADMPMANEVKTGVIDCCVDMQELVSQMSVGFLRELRRHYYVTPTSYLELISTFKTLLSSQRKEVKEQKERYENGLTKLVDTAEQVVTMQVELEALQPQLKQATIETDVLLQDIARKQTEATAQKELVEAEEAVCNEQAADAKALKDSCEADLAEAIPALEGAVRALKTLSKGDIVEVKAMKKPPDAVKLTMEAVCIMMGVAAVKIKDPGGGTRKIDDYWGPAQKVLLGDSRFLQNLMDYDKDNIDPAIMEQVIPYAHNDKFKPEIVKKGSVAAAGLCKWVHAMVVYDRVAKVVAPKKASLKKAVGQLESAQAMLKEKQDQLHEVEDNLRGLQQTLKQAEDKKEELQNQVTDCSNRLVRAEQLIGGLGGERSRWTQLSKELQQTYDNVVGDIMLSSGVIAYLGAFTSVYRERAIHHWSDLLLSKNIKCSPNFSLSATLGQPVLIRTWTICKLPNDAFSIDNAIMMTKSNRWPLMVDPQGQANRWIKNLESEESLRVVKQTQSSFARELENSISFGKALLLENVGETLDPLLETVLLKQVVTAGGVASIRLGDSLVEYDQNFKLYITTKLRNPHYPPELCVKVNLLNFMATMEGLEDQMLGIVVAKEEPVLEATRERLVVEDAENKKQLKAIEDTILRMLKESTGNILDDEVLIGTLSKSKVTAVLIEEKVKEAVKTQETIAEVRSGYQPVAFRASQLFFCIADLEGVDPMYQYSLEWFINLFVAAIEKAPKGSGIDERLENLNNTFTYNLYNNVCRSLFEKDKLLFSFLLCTKLMLGGGSLSPVSLRYFLQGSTSIENSTPNPLEEGGWLSDKCWGDVLGLEGVDGFTGFHIEFSSQLGFWNDVYDAANPMELIQTRLGERFDDFQLLLLLRIIRPDCAVDAVMEFVAARMGTKFIEPPPFDLMGGYEDSSCATPLIFVLTPGADPMTELSKLADELGFGRKLFSISLGQGQGPLAENAIGEAIDKGTWVCLQNCHLSVSWMPTLERLCEDITPERAHSSFRLWLTSEPSKHFPSYILQNGVKMTNEPPKGMRANLLGSYASFTEDYISSVNRSAEFKKLLFGLCFFHATVRERRKFGPLGWNIQYVFSGPDLRISVDQLRIFLDDLRADDPIPYAALAYLAGECNYGGRVTDDKDRRCLLNILSDFYTADIMRSGSGEDGYKFSPSGTYYAPADMKLRGYRDYIRGLPYSEGPEVFGLHDNANISCAIAETSGLLDTALSLQPRSGGGGGKSWDETLAELSADILGRVPRPFDTERALLDFPVAYHESMNTVLTQELGRFNRLTHRVVKSLTDVQKAIKGLVVMSGELEAMGNSMVNGQVPSMWSAVSYPSLKPLGPWVNDLLMRLMFLKEWMDNGVAPSVYWISGFFFTQAFITGTMQNYARRHRVPIDVVAYDFKVLTAMEMARADKKSPDDGAYVKGLFLEGAGWDGDHHHVTESKPRELFVPMPYIHLLPNVKEKIEEVTPKGNAHVYLCPVYKTSVRQGTLSTTGHSTNFVMFMRLPMAQEHQQKLWIKRGAAMLTQLDN